MRVRGKGLVVKSTKTDAGGILVLPRWCTRMLSERAQRLDPEDAEVGSRPVFPAPFGGWRDPSNTQADLRDAFTAAGFDWVTSHVFRKTVATLIDKEADTKSAAAQLGHASEDVTSTYYIAKPALAPDVSEILERLGTDQVNG